MSVIKRGEQYFIRQKGNLVALDPQPSHDDVAILQRNYIHTEQRQLIQETDFVVKPLQEIIHRQLYLAVVEYRGKFPENPCKHGNAKHCNNEYIKTKPETMEAVKTAVHHSAPNMAFSQLCTENMDNSPNAPRDLKLVQNAKYRQDRKSRSDGVMVSW